MRNKNKSLFWPGLVLSACSLLLANNAIAQSSSKEHSGMGEMELRYQGAPSGIAPEATKDLLGRLGRCQSLSPV